jgi:hypothetical protein
MVPVPHNRFARGDLGCCTQLRQARLMLRKEVPEVPAAERFSVPHNRLNGDRHRP